MGHDVPGPYPLCAHVSEHPGTPGESPTLTLRCRTQKFAAKLQSPREDLGRHVLGAWPLLKQRTAAYLGLLGCIIVFVLGSGLWWEDRHDTAGERAAKVIGAYGAVSISLFFFIPFLYVVLG